MPKVSGQPCITLAFSLKGFTPVLMIRVSYAVSFHTVTFTTLQTPVTDIGVCLTGIVRRTDLSAETFDPSPLLMIASIIIENNPTQTRVWCHLV